VDAYRITVCKTKPGCYSQNTDYITPEPQRKDLIYDGKWAVEFDRHNSAAQ